MEAGTTCACACGHEGRRRRVQQLCPGGRGRGEGGRGCRGSAGAVHRGCTCIVKRRLLCGAWCATYMADSILLTHGCERMHRITCACGRRRRRKVCGAGCKHACIALGVCQRLLVVMEEKCANVAPVGMCGHITHKSCALSLPDDLGTCALHKCLRIMQIRSHFCHRSLLFFFCWE